MGGSVVVQVNASNMTDRLEAGSPSHHDSPAHATTFVNDSAIFLGRGVSVSEPRLLLSPAAGNVCDHGRCEVHFLAFVAAESEHRSFGMEDVVHKVWPCVGREVRQQRSDHEIRGQH